MNRTLPDVQLRFGRRHPHAQVPGSIGPGFLQLALVLLGRFTGRMVGGGAGVGLDLEAAHQGAVDRAFVGDLEELVAAIVRQRAFEGDVADELAGRLAEREWPGDEVVAEPTGTASWRDRWGS